MCFALNTYTRVQVYKIYKILKYVTMNDVWTTYIMLYIYIHSHNIVLCWLGYT